MPRVHAAVELRRKRFAVRPTFVRQMTRFPPFAIADSGTSPISLLSVPLISWTSTIHASAVPGLLMAMAVLVVLLLLSLGVAWAAIRKGGALPHPKYEIVGRGFSTAAEG